MNLSEYSLECAGSRGPCVFRILDTIYFCDWYGQSYVQLDRDDNVVSGYIDSHDPNHILRYKGRSVYEFGI